MDTNRFENLLRSLSRSPSRRSAVRLLAGLVLGGLFSVGHLSTDAKKRGTGKRKKGKGKKKVTLCHNGQTITVSKSARKRHQKHGDSFGPCPSSPPPGPTCGALFASCTTGANCCSDVCNDFNFGGTPQNLCSCLAKEQICVSNANCCSGTCDPGTSQCTCHEAGDICTVDAMCCSPLTCQDKQPVGQVQVGTCK